jgi:hypothetical protein
MVWNNEIISNIFLNVKLVNISNIFLFQIILVNISNIFLFQIILVNNSHMAPHIGRLSRYMDRFFQHLTNKINVYSKCLQVMPCQGRSSVDIHVQGLIDLWNVTFEPAQIESFYKASSVKRVKFTRVPKL